MLTRWDWQAIARAAVLGTIALALGWLLTAATDEGNVPWTERLGRTLPLAPVCAALGVWGALAPVRARGEALALEALGRRPSHIGAPAVAGASAVGLIAAAVIAVCPRVGVGGFFPTATRGVEWRPQGDGFLNASRGVFVGPDGAPLAAGAAAHQPDALHAVAQDAAAHDADAVQDGGEPGQLDGGASSWPRRGVPRYGRAVAAGSTIITALALSMLVAQALLVRRPEPWRGAQLRARGIVSLLVAGVAAFATVALFQASAAGRVVALIGLVPAFVLLAFAAQRYRTAS